MKKKLYKVTATITALFAAEDDKGYVNECAGEFIAEELNVHPLEYNLTEITSVDDIPTEWLDGQSFIWGVDANRTAKEFLAEKESRNSEEHKQYLKLKEKFKD